MKYLVGCFGVFIGFCIVLSILINFWQYIFGFFAIIAAITFVVSWNDKRKNKAVKEEEIQQLKVRENSVEYKMTKLLNVAGFHDPDGAKRQKYVHKERVNYNLRDYWYHYLDLRAKLLLNNTSTHREEEVLNLMCDELLDRLKYVEEEVEVLDIVRKQFIEEHLTPLLSDIVEIMEGIRPTQSFNIDAYELLKTAKAEHEPIILTKK